MVVNSRSLSSLLSAGIRHDLTLHLSIDNHADLLRIDAINNIRIAAEQGSDRTLPGISSSFCFDTDRLVGRGEYAADLLCAIKQTGWPRLQSFCKERRRQPHRFL